MAGYPRARETRGGRWLSDFTGNLPEVTSVADTSMGRRIGVEAVQNLFYFQFVCLSELHI